MWCWYFSNKPITYLDTVAFSFMSPWALKPLGLTWQLPAERGGGYCYTDHMARGDVSRNDLDMLLKAKETIALLTKRGAAASQAALSLSALSHGVNFIH